MRRRGDAQPVDRLGRDVYRGGRADRDVGADQAVVIVDATPATRSPLGDSAGAPACEPLPPITTSCAFRDRRAPATV
jgi:hypothetical protein